MLWNAVGFAGEHTMRCVVVFVVFLLGTGIGFAGKSKEPLPDYVGRFKELDAKIRAIDAADPGCTNYVQWMEAAVGLAAQITRNFEELGI